MTLGALTVLSVGIAVLWTLTDSSSDPGARFSNRERLLDLSLTALRACVGTDNLAPETDSTAHQLLATVASVTGALVPAVLLSVVLIKMFTVQPVVWRRKASISLAARSNSQAYARAHRGSDQAVLAVRFYNHLLNVAMMDVHAEAHLRYLEESPRDGLLAMYKQRLKVVGEDGRLCDERVWCVVERAAPFTLWIPIGSPVGSLPLESLQGKELCGLQGARILVRFRAKAVGTGTELSDERWFELDGEDLELGEFVPVEPDLAGHVSAWAGWRGFDDLSPANPPEEPTRPASSAVHTRLPPPPPPTPP
ncbi:hypothetical protein [Streptomyces sp. IB201691-2A2]|uniref:hypothetical protein n=1 Tax=Streptomyces sp. IB201691-2A2 TaxID=2561920 RepID=UPI00117E353A|nr:hypothetical protein [Streptomyces sp. IB201691-2A2]TRO64614.1 hypothetical protein E4K73_14020 [Streptomyces sp. IB201691-2A2]